MRCIASSPVAAVQALKTRAKIEDLTQEDEKVLEKIVPSTAMTTT